MTNISKLIIPVCGLLFVQFVSAQVLQTYNSGSNTSWTVPAGVTHIQVEAWGGGGRGGSRTSGNNSYGGGGGGAFASSILTVTPGTTYYIKVGSGSSNNSDPGGDSWFTTTSNSSSGALVLAKGGSSVPNDNSNGANGGSYASSIGDVRNNGGRGADGDHSDYGGGGGGSSAGASGLGVNATNNFGAVGPSGYDGIGGNGQTGNNGNGSSGTAPGGGGGGARRSSSGSPSGGNGANGRVIITDLTSLAYDLSITKTVNDNNTTPLVGTDVTFNIEVENYGTQQAQGISVLDLLPSGFTYVSHNAPPGTTYNNITGIWDIGNLDDGNVLELEITATVNETGSYANIATLSADLDNRGMSQSNITLFPQQSSANLQLTKEVDNTMPAIGDEVTFTLTAYNAGPQDATNVEVSNILSFGYSYTSDSGGFNNTTGKWTIGSLNSGQSETLTVTATVNPSGNYSSLSQISGDQFDPVTTNNNSEAFVYPIFPIIEIILPCATTEYDLEGFDITPPPGTEISWHDSSVADDSNKISTPSTVMAGRRYYVAFYDPVSDCYGATSEVNVKRSCLLTNPMVRKRIIR